MTVLVISPSFIQHLTSIFHQSRESTVASPNQFEIKLGKNAKVVNPDNLRLLKVNYASAKATEMSIISGRFRFYFKDENNTCYWIEPDQIMAVDSQRQQVILHVQRHFSA